MSHEVQDGAAVVEITAADGARATIHLNGGTHASDATAVVRLVDDARTRGLWPHPFVAGLSVRVHAALLEVTLSVENTGASAVQFTAELHPYFRMMDACRALVRHADDDRGTMSCALSGDVVDVIALTSSRSFPADGPVYCVLRVSDSVMIVCCGV